MNPIAALQADGSPAAWLRNARTDHHPDRDGEYHYLVGCVGTNAIADLTMLALDGWQTRLSRGPNGTMRVTITAPGVGAFGSEIASPTGPSTGSVPSLPGGGTPSHARAREGPVPADLFSALHGGTRLTNKRRTEER